VQRTARSFAGRGIALFLCALLASSGCGGTPLPPHSGLAEWELVGAIPVPGGLVNAAGGNLLVRRRDLSIDTIMGGAYAVGASYNSTDGAWLWSFQLRYDGASFRDPSGRLFELGELADGAAVPGSHWVRVDADTVKTKGGRAYHFDASGRLDRVTWSGSDYPRIRHVWHASSLEIAQCASALACAPFLRVELHADGRPLRAIDLRSGRSAEFAWDDSRRLAVARSPRDVALGLPGTRYEYAVGGSLLTAVTNSEGERIEYAWRTGPRIRSVTQVGEGNPTHLFAFHAKVAERDLYRTVHLNPLGGRTRYWLDGAGRVREIERPDTGELATLLWEGARPVEVTDFDGATTRIAWSDDDAVLIEQPSGNQLVVSYAHDALELRDPRLRPVARVEDSIGLVEERRYDARGRLLSIQNGEGEIASATWTDTALASATGALGARVEFPVRGVHGHWLVMEGDADDARIFDPVGNALVASTVSQLGGVLSRRYDADRNLAEIALAASAGGSVAGTAAVAIERRSDGRTVAVRRPGGADHELDYDAIGRPLVRRERVEGAFRATSFAYDAAGHLVARERPNGMREEFDRDAFGRLVEHRALRDGVLEGRAVYTWSRGRLASAYDSIRAATELYSYDASGRLASVVFGFGESLTVEYDLRSRVVAETLSLPGQGALRRIEYEHDLADRVVGLRADGGEMLVQLDYEGGLPATVVTGNGLVRQLAYDAATGELRSALTTDAAGLVLETSTVSRSAEISPPREQIRASVSTPLASTREEYWLELGGHLSAPDGYVGKRVFGWSDGESFRSFSYDARSNRVDDAGGDSFAYDLEGTRLLSASLPSEGASLTYAYDEAGFATSRGGVPIQWTATGRLASFGALSISWDMRGRPVAWSDDVVSRDHTLFGGRVARDPGSGALAPLDLGLVTVAFGSPERRYRHFDFRSNVGFVSDESGTVVAHYRYRPYGLDAVFGAAPDDVSFAGRPQIGDLALLGARVYDPAVGRFLSPDPRFQLVNAYAYAQGNPVRFWDPDGLAPRPISRAQIRAVLAAGGALLGLVGGVTRAAVAVGLLSGAAMPLALAAGTTALTVGTALAIDLAIGALSDPSTGAPGVPALPDTGSGPCPSGCAPPVRSQNKVVVVTPGPADGGGGGGEDVGSPAPPALCAPTALATTPDLGGALPWLLPINLGLAVWVGRRCRRRRGS
jgi:RHS repeat-associated protein